MNPYLKYFHKFIKTGAFIALGAMLIVVTIQVFSRLFMDSAPHWTEEAARMLFIYSVAFGTGIGIINGDFINIDLVGKFLSPKKELILQLLANIVIIAFSVVIIASGARFIMLGWDEKSPALKAPMALVFASIPMIGLAILIFKAGQLRKNKF